MHPYIKAILVYGILIVHRTEAGAIKISVKHNPALHIRYTEGTASALPYVYAEDIETKEAHRFYKATSEFKLVKLIIDTWKV